MLSLKRAFGHTLAMVLAVGVATALTVSARAHSAHEMDAEPDLELYLGDMYVRAANAEPGEPIHVEAGEFHLVQITNEGTVEHELHFGREANPEEGLYQVNLFGPDLDGPHAAHGFLGVVLEPGESVSLHAWIPENRSGEWEVGCFVPGHYQAGQHASLIIE